MLILPGGEEIIHSISVNSSTGEFLRGPWVQDRCGRHFSNFELEQLAWRVGEARGPSCCPARARSNGNLTIISLPKELWLSILSEALGIDIYETFTWRIKLTETQFCAFLVSESANAMVDLMSRLVQVQDPNSLFSDPVAMLSVCYNSSSCITNFNCRPGKNGAQ